MLISLHLLCSGSISSGSQTDPFPLLQKLLELLSVLLEPLSLLLEPLSVLLELKHRPSAHSHDS
jgi:hypothetical protein